MKKFFILLAGLLLVSSSGAFAARENFTLHASRQGDFRSVARPMSDLTSKRQSPVKAPAGETVYYDKESAGTFVLNGQMDLYKDMFPGVLIWGSDNKVYFQNLISVFPEEYYVEGTINGNIITVPTNQTVSYIPEEGYGFNFGVLKITLDEDEDMYNFEYDPTVTSVEFIVGDDGSIDMVLPGEPFDGENVPEYIAGIYYSDDYMYTGCGDFSQHYERLSLQQVIMPADADVQQYVYIDEFNYANIVDVAFYGDYLYIRGLTSNMPEGTIRARLDGNKATVAQNQYVGIYFDLYYIYTKVLYENPDYDEGDPDSPAFIMAPENVGFELNIDPDRHRIYADTPGVYLSFHCDENDFLNSLGYYGIFQLTYQETFAGTPANPVELSYETRWADMQGFNDFFFTLSNFSEQGYLLDVDKLYYKIFVNGEAQIFVEGEIIDLLGEEKLAYNGVPIQVELLPYEFDNNDDIFKYGPNVFDVGIYRDDVETIGVQSVYYFDNEFTYSSIVTLDVETGQIFETSGVIAPASVCGEAVAVEYYNLNGMKVSNPDKGIYIETVRFSDGRTVVRKVVR